MSPLPSPCLRAGTLPFGAHLSFSIPASRLPCLHLLQQKSCLWGLPSARQRGRACGKQPAEPGTGQEA